MKTDKFRGWLLVVDCEFESVTRSYYIYKNPATGATANFPNTANLDSATMYWTCQALEVDMPPEFKDLQDKLDKID